MTTTTDRVPRVGSGRPGPTTEQIEDLIKGHPFLKGLSPHQQRILADCAMYSHFDAGELVIREGDPANRFYLIQTGRVGLEAHLGGGGIAAVQILRAGDVLGWSWLFPPYFWHLDARALEATEVIFFYGTPLREECDTDHELGYELLKRMGGVIEQRLRAVQRRLAEDSAPASGGD
jgi:CRP-like cAMP-binding protein